MSIFVADEQAEGLDLGDIRGLAELVVSHEGYPSETEVTLLLVTNEEMQAYNLRFLDRDQPTDVLAFPVEDLEPGNPPDVDPTGPPLLLGDVIVAPAYVRTQADDFGVTFEDELSLMVTHGLLHLLGYDHQNDEEAEAMESREREILALIGRTRR